MDNINNITWVLEPHTNAKHEILRYYLGAWFPILATRYRRVLYVDGFAGPGEYKGGEDGSPLIALKVAENHILRGKLLRQGVELVFYFVERDKARYANLKKKIGELNLPTNFRITTECETFERAFGKVIASIEEQSKQMAPAFVFIDPFGPTGFPMSLVKRIARQKSSEVLITFNYQALNQWFLSDNSKHERLDELYGSTVWRKALQIPVPSGKEKYLVEAYKEALETSSWKVRHFQMKNKHNQTQYYLFFATSSPLGMRAMKSAMWSAAPNGDFQYSDLINPAQARLFEESFDEEYSRELAEQLYQNRKGISINKRDLENVELAWHPICIDRHLTRALRYLEYDVVPSKIVGVESAGGKRRIRTYPENCTIIFAP